MVKPNYCSGRPSMKWLSISSSNKLKLWTLILVLVPCWPNVWKWTNGSIYELQSRAKFRLVHGWRAVIRKEMLVRSNNTNNHVQVHAGHGKFNRCVKGTRLNRAGSELSSVIICTAFISIHLMELTSLPSLRSQLRRLQKGGRYQILFNKSNNCFGTNKMCST